MMRKDKKASTRKYLKYLLPVLAVGLIIFGISKWPAFADDTILTLSADKEIKAGEVYSLNVNIQKNAGKTLTIDLPKGTMVDAKQLKDLNSGHIDGVVYTPGNGQLKLALSDKFKAPNKLKLNFANIPVGKYKLVATIGEEKATVDLYVKTSEAAVKATAKISDVTKNKAALPETGWVAIDKLEEASVKMKDSSVFHYNFGPTNNLGASITTAGKASVIPNATITNPKGGRIQHLHAGDVSLETTTGLLMATKSVNSPAGPYVLMGLPYNQVSGVKYYKRILPDGMTAYRVSYDVPVNNDGISTTLHVDTTMTGIANAARVRIENYVTNVGKSNIKDFVLGNSVDTDFDGNDNVVLRYLGLNQGIYMDGQADKYRLKYLFNVPKQPENWTGRQSLGNQNAKNFVGSTNNDYTRFTLLTETGYEARVHEPNEAMTKADMNTGIHMKNQPMLFESGKTANLNYDVAIDGEVGEVPEPPIEDLGQVNVQYLDEAGAELEKPEFLSGEVGTDYTATSKSISGYVLERIDGNEKGKFTKELQTVKYIYKKRGDLVLVEAPTSINFGEKLKVSSKDEVYPHAKVNGNLSVQDFREPGNNWSLSAKLLQEMSSVESTHTMPNSLYYYQNSNNLPLSLNDSILVYTTKTTNNNPVVISNNWQNNPLVTGPVLKVKAGQAHSEHYNAMIQWTLQDVPNE